MQFENVYTRSRKYCAMMTELSGVVLWIGKLSSKCLSTVKVLSESLTQTSTLADTIVNSYIPSKANCERRCEFTGKKFINAS